MIGAKMNIRTPITVMTPSPVAIAILPNRIARFSRLAPMHWPVREAAASLTP